MSRYELMERIGVGGMAEVFRGRVVAVGGFEKPVAIKKILPHLGQDSRFVKMLMEEAKILASLRQRNIVQIFDVGLGDDGEYFLVMEYVHGTDLGALYGRMEQRYARFPVDLALHIGSEVCEALDHAHRATDRDGKPLGLIHRDVSPSNVLLSESGEVKLTDFGIAKRMQDGSVVESLKGKFAYMAPEQARGESLGKTADIYSLGMVLWELLTGRRLFSGASELEILRLVQEGRVPRPTDIDPRFPGRLEAILMQALARDPDERFPTAGSFGAALRDYRYSTSTAAGDPAKEISRLVKTYSYDEKGPPTARPPTVVRINTIAGFPLKEVAADLEADTERAPLAAASRFDSFDEDAPTRYAPMPARQRENGRPSTTLTEATVEIENVPPVRTPPPSPDDAETRFLKGLAARSAQKTERAATPTIKDVFPAGALMDEDELDRLSREEVALADAELGTGRRRNVVTLVILLMVAIALVAFVLTGTIFSGERGSSDDSLTRPPPTGTGETLPGPSMRNR